MSTEAKRDKVAEITEKVQSSAGIYLVNYRGLSVKDAQELRRSLREADSEMKVYKNRLVNIAFENEEVEGLEDLLNGPTAFVFFEEDPVAPAKVLKEFSKANSALEIKGGWNGTSALGVDQVHAIADLPSREELVAKLIGTIQNPVAKVVRVLNAPMQEFTNVLNSIKEQKEDEAA